ncbi:MAG: hypothetical protein ABJC05_05825, partial [Pyrinomonadaceae bacterium]
LEDSTRYVEPDTRETVRPAPASERRKRSNRDRDEFRNEIAYQKATKDYSSRLGDRGIYMRYFQEAFSHGYDAGYKKCGMALSVQKGNGVLGEFLPV